MSDDGHIDSRSGEVQKDTHNLKSLGRVLFRLRDQ